MLEQIDSILSRYRIGKSVCCCGANIGVSSDKSDPEITYECPRCGTILKSEDKAVWQ